MTIDSIQLGSLQTNQNHGVGASNGTTNNHLSSTTSINDNTYLTALIASSAAVPIVASIIIVAVYVAPFSIDMHRWIAVPLGTIITVLLWLLFAIPCRRFALAENANRCSYGNLVNQLNDLEVRIDILKNNQYANTGKSPNNISEIALNEAHTWCEDIKKELNCKGFCWLLATGYINMWKLLHHAEEALIEIEPVEHVFNKAVHDELCIQDSNMSNSEALLDKLRIAVTKLSPSATVYLTKQPPDREAHSFQNGKDNMSDSVSENEARSALREVRRTLNEYRDNLWEGLIHSRNRLMMIITITGFLMYILLCLPIVSNIDSSYVIAATIFFLVGAIVGLFNRLYLETKIDNAINDFGLSMARVIATPVLSGLAAVSGVLIIAMVASTTQNSIKFPEDLASIYTINPWHILLAAIFGLAPGLLIGMLQQKAETYKSDIKSSKAS